VTTEEIMLRLLELEQRFDSYCGLYEEELTQLRTDIRELRQGLLANLQTVSRDSKAAGKSLAWDPEAPADLTGSPPIADI
jgi:hypothetical protein